MQLITSILVIIFTTSFSLWALECKKRRNKCSTCRHDGGQVYDLGTACTGCTKENDFKYYEKRLPLNSSNKNKIKCRS